ncbi:hypothetical protein [Methanobacterium alcaliphilum]|uniref:hypothetical protein n=1 Tax=Methanobacterium alcaliphilum TaxID=392018 RepID=UPI00200A29B3|nr:hypothetical protein [Methanobacterium alcaliphilum]MCK9152078.1 hypothetical protein [Methanobacterium alcaliphilum]
MSTDAGSIFRLILIYLPVITGIINIFFLLGMLLIYGERYKEVKSKFTSILLFFALLLILQNVLFTIYFLAFPPGRILYALLPTIYAGLELMALALLLRITLD